MKMLTVYLPNRVCVYVEGIEGVEEITPYIINGAFWYWRVTFTNKHWLDITAPCILETNYKK